MNIHLRTQQITLPDGGGEQIRLRLGEAFSRLASRISHLHVTLKDVNGPRGGRDKVCILRAELAGGGEVLVSERNEHMRRALDRCARRFKEAIQRRIKRGHPRMGQRERWAEALQA
ncbi:MAG: hypothetical protein PVG91_11440 [Gammaproteobacteria bacterium]|jgi:hypothetical protein